MDIDPNTQGMPPVQPGVDPALAQQVLSQNSMAEDPAAIRLARKQQMINAMRGNAQMQANDQGHMMGKVYAPGNTLATTLGAAAQGLGAAMHQGDVDQGMDKIGASRTGARGAYLNALVSKMRRPPVIGTPEVPDAMPREGVGSMIGFD